jgi:hypothetical protein
VTSGPGGGAGARSPGGRPYDPAGAAREPAR